MVQYNVAAPTGGPSHTTRDLSIQENEAFSYVFTIVDSDGAAVSLSGNTVRFVIYDSQSDEARHQIAGSVGGASNNEVTVAVTTTETADHGHFKYALWNITDDEVMVSGRYEITRTPKAI